ncbi:cupin domain-containing protein [Pendulispora rubella]|uniref:Cupin domain-containing protein n=1 Tax=Pendulispora rubella TaxID=2741070 RepID=A0ABZ2LJ82_9BACT
MSAMPQANVPFVRVDSDEADSQYFEYTSSANPVGIGLIRRVPYHEFPASSYADGPTRIVTLDLSRELGTDYPATGPSLCAHFVRVLTGERLRLDGTMTSRVFYVIGGRGEMHQGDVRMAFGEGDFIAMPGNADVTVIAKETVSLYYVNDAPLLSYLGVTPIGPRFAPTRYPAARARAELHKVATEPLASKRNRISVLLGNARFPQTRTVSHVMWAMFGILPAHSEQKPHRHQSIALDFIAACEPGCYSLVGRELDARHRIVRPTRVDWKPGMAFVTPPGAWHAHYNESAQPAHLIPIQDAGLHTYLRSLDIRFSPGRE